MIEGSDQSIIIEMLPGRYFLAVWYLSNSTKIQKSDWMLSVFKDPDEEVWRARYRHKYYNSPEPFDTKDERSHYALTLVNQTEPQLIEKFDALQKSFGDLADFRHRDFIYLATSDPEAIMDRLKTKPWIHSRMQERAKP